jgi:hypothetical protein
MRPAHGDATSAVDRTAGLRRIAEMAAVPRADELLDPTRLSSLLGVRAAPRYLRMKPGRSFVVAWEEPDGEGARSWTGGHGWTGIFVDSDKRDNAVRRARRAGVPLVEHTAAGGGGPHLLSGPVWADPSLVSQLSRVRAEAEPGTRWEVLRFNPRRRLVLRAEDSSGARVLRTAAGGSGALAEATGLWARLGAPVLPAEVRGRVRGPDGAGTVVSPWWGTGDLRAHPEEAAARRAGRAVAAVHRRSLRGVRSGSEAPALPRTGVRVLRSGLGPAARAVAAAAPALGSRARRLADRLGPRLDDGGPRVLLHGDLSPDQVLVDAAGEIRLIDLDRAGAGQAARDVGSWLAACRGAGLPRLAAAFTDGYREVAEARASGSDEGRLLRTALAGAAVWEAHALVLGALDPLRRLAPDWQSQLERRLREAEEVSGL